MKFVHNKFILHYREDKALRQINIVKFPVI